MGGRFSKFKGYGLKVCNEWFAKVSNEWKSIVYPIDGSFKKYVIFYLREKKERRKIIYSREKKERRKIIYFLYRYLKKTNIQQ